MTGEQNGALLSVRNLQVSFPADRGIARVVDGVTFRCRARVKRLVSSASPVPASP